MIENTVLFISNYFVYAVCYLFIVQLLCFYPESQAKRDWSKSKNTVQIFNILNKSNMELYLSLGGFICVGGPWTLSYVHNAEPTMQHLSSLFHVVMVW